MKIIQIQLEQFLVLVVLAAPMATGKYGLILLHMLFETPTL